MGLFFRSFYRTETTLQLKRYMSSVPTMRPIHKLLIANRGEIACRIMKTAKRLGIQTVAVFSDADQSSMHVSMADEAYHIGPASSQLSYLRSDKIIEVAKTAKCQAIHPGYGFLSEKPEFAELCQAENVIFVGPPSSAIRDMGIKSTSKHIMSNAGVPIIEGYHGEDQAIETLQKEADRIGFPIMIKAVRGGGGKGMRIAMTREEFLAALESAKNESMKAFGDDNVLLERYIGDPRHVEVQVFADMYGNAVHLFERDCSVQRRHQKIIEEAPAPGLSSQLRSELGAAAVRAAKAVNYVGAGTVEFILDRFTHSFHFMEMNTRLQVEHPISEMITNTDLVEWQLKIAAGEKLPVTQDQIILNGHSFEARIYAEDPNDNFLPRPGPLLHLSTPQASENVRIETGVRQGDEVSIHYDPMIAKLVVWGKTRTEALSKLSARLTEYNIAGVETNTNFLLDLSRHSEFVQGNVHTSFIPDHQSSLFLKRTPSKPLLAQLALSDILASNRDQMEDAFERNDNNNPFVLESGFRINHNLIRKFTYFYNEEKIEIKVKYLDLDKFQVQINDDPNWYDVKGRLENRDLNKLELKCHFSGNLCNSNVVIFEDHIYIFDKEGQWKFSKETPKFVQSSENSDMASSSGQFAVSPMPGLIEKINVTPGATVQSGDPLFVIIAMKMEHVVKAGRGGKIAKVNYQVGENVGKNSIIVEFDETS